ncbi:unnamed protein product [Cyprideis torosa]|uniref:Uncharacterized protein n=1 Tax=Cyprideis torosa TaxID=163714 RepID=A0A7R8ZKH6_9CRUS|nr:unnamed protein product [Cyprideis torosa]CAG0881729.1 unnamed protein product [Cyprideis torosa]
MGPIEASPGRERTTEEVVRLHEILDSSNIHESETEKTGISASPENVEGYSSATLEHWKREGSNYLPRRQFRYLPSSQSLQEPDISEQEENGLPLATPREQVTTDVLTENCVNSNEVSPPSLGLVSQTQTDDDGATDELSFYRSTEPTMVEKSGQEHQVTEAIHGDRRSDYGKQLPYYFDDVREDQLRMRHAGERHDHHHHDYDDHHFEHHDHVCSETSTVTVLIMGSIIGSCVCLAILATRTYDAWKDFNCCDCCTQKNKCQLKLSCCKDCKAPSYCCPDKSSPVLCNCANCSYNGNSPVDGRRAFSPHASGRPRTGMHPLAEPYDQLVLYEVPLCMPAGGAAFKKDLSSPFKRRIAGGEEQLSNCESDWGETDGTHKQQGANSSGIKRNTDGYSRTARIDSSIIQDIFRESLKKALEPKIEPIFKGNSIIFRPRSYAERYAVEKGRGERNELRREVFSFITNKSFKQPEISEEEYSIPDHDKTTTPSIYTETYTAKWSSLVQLPETIPRSTEESAYTDDDILEDDISKTKQRSGTVRTTEFEELRATNIEENPITTEFDVADEFEEGESSSSFEVNPNSSTESTVLDEKMVVEDVTKPSFSFPEKEEEDDLLEKTSIGDGFTEEKAFQTNDEQRVKDEIDFGNEEETTVIGTTLATTTPKVKSTTEDIHEDVEEELENTIPNAIIPISLKDHKQEVNISTSSASKALSKISTEDSAEGYEGRKFGELRGREITPMFCTSFRMPSFSLSNEINSLNEFGDPLAKDRVARKNAPRRIVSEHEFDYDDIDDDDFPVTERACHHHHHQDSSCHLHRGDHHGHEQKELMLEILIIVLCCVSSCMLLFQTFRFVSDYLSNGEQEYCGTSRCRSGGTLTLTPDTINVSSRNQN